MLVLIGVAVAMIGLGLLKRGRWPKRAGDTPHCGKCDYRLTGLPIDAAAVRCPECGSNLIATTIVHGERHPLPKMAATGGLLLTIGLLVSTWSIHHQLRNVDWYRYRPNAWVLDDLDVSDPAINRRAWDELQRRVAAGKLSSGQQARLIDDCLQAQAAPQPGPLLVPMLEYVADLAAARKLSDAQRDRFFEQAIGFKLLISSSFSSELQMPYGLSYGGCAPSPRDWFSKWEGEYLLDGEPLAHAINSSGIPFPHGREGYWLGPCPVGHHVLRAEIAATIGGGGFETDAARRPAPLYQHKFVYEIPFDVFPDHPATLTLPILGPAIKAAILDSSKRSLVANP